MKKILFLILVIHSFESSSQCPSDIFNNRLLVNKIISAYKKIQLFENKFAGSNSDEYEDSISIANDALVKLFSKKSAGKLCKSDLLQIKANTGIKIVFSNDKKITVVSWRVFESYEIPMCSNFIFYNGTAKAVSLNGTEDSDFGDNIQNDKILQVKLKDKACYILTGSNKCGNLCILEMASLYFISNGSIKKCSNSFFDGKKYFDDVQFDYLINEKMKVEPSFKIQAKKLVYPTFNADNDIIVGSNGLEITCSCSPSDNKLSSRKTTKHRLQGSSQKRQGR